MHATQSRPDRSFSLAREPQLGAVHYAIPVRVLCVCQAARDLVDGLSKRAARVLSFFAAVNRAGKVGYRGTAACYEAVADAVRLTTNERCGRSTLEGALGELIEAGLLLRSSWVPEGRAQRKIQLAPGEWKTVTLRALVLTPTAIALWSKGRRKAPVHLHTQKMSSTVEPISSLFIREEVESPSTLRPQGNRRRCEHEGTESSVVSSASTAADSSNGLPPVNGEDSNKAKPAKSRPTTGPTVIPPPRPKRDQPNNWTAGRLAFLADLHTFLQPFPTREADCLFARARLETRPDWSSPLPAAVDWDRFIYRWRRWSRRERFGQLRREVLPVLRAAVGPPAGPSASVLEILFRGPGDVAAVEDQAAEELPAEVPADISIPEKRKRIAEYAQRLKATKDPDLRALLVSSINMLLRQV